MYVERMLISIRLEIDQFTTIRIKHTYIFELEVRHRITVPLNVNLHSKIL